MHNRSTDLGPGSKPGPRSALFRIGTVSLAVFTIDQVFKTLAFNTGRDIGLLKPRLNHSTAWELMTLPPPVLVTTMAAVALIAGWVGWRMVGRLSLSPLALGLILGGTAGNIFDRALLGAVRDFAHVPGFGVFNLADGAIILGCAAWFISAARSAGA